ncbi:spondin-2 isoform X1 [Homalodisca vitripennis]|uniref:spondin-2 isoform X1 n=1 Tax=Homalodisca vitripennis TaxID=197043 RepID=UPI001EEAA12B|nr:spondin-2 isoform X1 [Homalodisca vitripennis]
MLPVAAVLLFVALASSNSTQPPDPQPCPPEKLTTYRVVLHTFWTRDLFPKHYPEWRPPAQWSKLIGKSHSRSYSLFRLGQKASPGVKAFSEIGRGDLLEAPGPGVFDEFVAPAIPTGAGRTEAQFFVDGNHSRVSLMSRIIPSPDWFIGIDSFNLCVDGNWLDTITIEVDPLDAGTDNGFTFTAPNWATSPQGVIYRITSRYPSHPAGSFYYPYLKRLPPIATFQFIKTREYELNEVFHHSEDDKRYDLVNLDQSNTISVINSNNDIQLEMEAERREQEMRLQQQLATKSTIARTNALIRHARKNRRRGLRRRQRLPFVTLTPPPPLALAPGVIPSGDKGALLNSIVQTYHDKESHKPRKSRKYSEWDVFKHGGSRDCRVGEWGEWGACSKTCGVGEMARRREVVKHARRGGKLCPPLLETKWCGTGNSLDCGSHPFW